MNRRDMIAKAAAYMNKRFGPVRQSDNPEQWYARLGQLVDFMAKRSRRNRRNLTTPRHPSRWTRATWPRD